MFIVPISVWILNEGIIVEMQNGDRASEIDNTGLMPVLTPCMQLNLF